MLSCRNKADSVATLKLFVQSSPGSAVESSPSVSPSKHGIFLAEPRPLFADGRPHSVSLASPTTESASSTLKQSSVARKLVESAAVESDRISSPVEYVAKGDDGGDLDVLRQRLAVLRRHQESGNSAGNPKINVIQPNSPLPPPAPPQGSVQPSPNDQSPPPYPATADAATANSEDQPPATPQADSCPSPGGPENELFFEDRRASSPFAYANGRGGSAGALTLEAAARQKMDGLSQQQQIQQQQRPVEQGFQRSTRPPDLDKGFQKGGQRRIVDFDNPRASPYEDRKMEDLIPQRNPPPVPVPSINRSSSGSWTKLQAAQAQAQMQAMRRAAGVTEGMDKPMVQVRRPDGHPGPPPRNNSGPDPSAGIGSSLIAAGAVSASITGARIPGVSARPSPHQRQNLHQRALSNGNFGGPASQKLKVIIPSGGRPVSQSMSPMNMAPAVIHNPALGHETPFRENDVHFTKALESATADAQADDDDSDSDDGLFARPVIRAGSSEPAKPTPAPQPQEASEKPNLSIATNSTKSVKFKSPTTTSTTGSGSNTTAQTPLTPEYEEGDDRQGFNSPTVFNSNSVPSSAAGLPHSPADYSRLGRRDSFRNDVWASRPAPEALVNHLDDYFPGLDLDQPVADENTSPPLSPALPGKQQSYQLSDPPVPRFDQDDASSTVGSMMAVPMNRGKAVAQRNVGRSGGLGRRTTIRDVAKRAHEPRRLVQPQIEGIKNSDIGRRKSTKMFGAKTIEIKGKRAAQHRQQKAPEQSQAQPFGGAPTRQATFKWFKGELIGKGTYGKVYLGMVVTTGEFIAVKQVEVSKSSGDTEHQKELIAALNQEIITMEHLDHVNIVQYLGCEREDFGTHMSIFLEYIPGGSIGSCLRKHGRFDEPMVRSLTRQTLSGLEYLHREGILHRDLKADNILLDVDGTCKISDFGISKKTDNIYGDDPGNSMQGSVFWMAPEVIRPEAQGYSAKIDIWSLGCVVLEMFAGRRPWSKEEVIGAIYKLGSERQAPPVPDDVSSVISPSAIGFLADCHTMWVLSLPFRLVQG